MNGGEGVWEISGKETHRGTERTMRRGVVYESFQSYKAMFVISCMNLKGRGPRGECCVGVVEFVDV